MLSETGVNNPALCISRGRVRARIWRRCKRERQRCMPNRYKKNSGNTEKSCTKFLCTKAKTGKNARKRRKRNHQSAIKAVVFAGSMTNNDLRNSHRRHIFAKESRHFLCFPIEKRMFPPWKTYVSQQGNIRLP